MKCPYCSYPESKVVDSRHSDDGLSIRRRRECLQCQRRFTTYETVESLPIVVVKKDGSRQSFDRNKILNGMLRACEKRPVSLAALETAAPDDLDGLDGNAVDLRILLHCAFRHDMGGDAGLWTRLLEDPTALDGQWCAITARDLYEAGYAPDGLKESASMG